MLICRFLWEFVEFSIWNQFRFPYDKCGRENSPSVLEGVPSGGVVILKYQNSLWKTAVVVDVLNIAVFENGRKVVGYYIIKYSNQRKECQDKDNAKRKRDLAAPF